MTTILQTTHQGGPAGSTRSIFDLSRHLARRQHRVIVACRPDTLLARLVIEAREPGLEHAPVEFEPQATLGVRFLELLNRERVDLVNSHASRDRRALTWLRLNRRLPQAFVVTRRTMPLTWFPELVAVGLAADRTIAVSDAVAHALRRRLHPSRRLRVVTNGISMDRIDGGIPDAAVAAARDRLGGLNGHPVVTMLARNKDQHVLIEALQWLERPIVLALVGIEANERLRELAASAPPRHRVVFVPFAENGLAFYVLTTVAVLPSRIEGLSQALLEAMAMGVPVVASDCGGNHDLIRHGKNGLLAPPLDSKAWAAALDRLLADPGETTRMARAGQATVREGYTIAHTVEATEAVYREALERRHA